MTRRSEHAEAQRFAQLLRRAHRYEKQLKRLEEDFDKAESLEAELRINDEIATARTIYLKVLRELEERSQKLP